MAWYSDEEFVLRNDNRERAITARSARKQRTHCGKGGSVRLPHDNLTKGQLKKMSGEVKQYNLNEPMKWEDFKSLPDDLKVKYINGLRERFSVPDSQIANMLGISRSTFGNYIKCYGMRKGDNRTAGWDMVGFFKWVDGKTEESCKNMAPTKAKDEASHSVVVPPSGTLHFSSNDIDDILNTIKSVLQYSTHVNAAFSWNLNTTCGECGASEGCDV